MANKSGAFVQVTPYLYFKGNCESALRFYEACGLGKITELRRIFPDRYRATPVLVASR